ncbi:hypothetical protein [uncultured Psychrobacter sp.]|uniref:hypothetical protein n=1 Tax=uncultured Psychrobacter sp. TaxID=259303 RepID=UPI003458085B
MFRGLLAFNATSLLVIIYLVQQGITLDKFFPWSSQFNWITSLPNLLSYLTYMIVTVLLTGLSIFLSSNLGKDTFESGEIVSIEYANNSFLPSYLGYFFVALSIDNWETLFFVYIILFVFTFLSQALYFNPLFLIFRYNFYNVANSNGVEFFLISRRNFRKPEDVALTANRINNYTYIEGLKSGLCNSKSKKVEK